MHADACGQLRRVNAGTRSILIHMSDIVQKLWGFCHTLRHDGIDYGDYIEQITYLLFIKMADERNVKLPEGCDWKTLVLKSGTDLTDHYVDVLRKLGTQKGLLGDIFAGALSRFTNPVNLKRLIGLIDETEWTELNIDVKGEAFEGLLEKAASEGKKGAGQYFTPRILIQSIVRCMKPDPRKKPDFTICDPACGTGGFLVCSYEWLLEQTKGGALDRDVALRVKKSTYFGQELVARPRRLALMNLFLHNVEPSIKFGDSIYENPDSRRFDIVLTNPAVRHERGEPGTGPRGLHDLDLQQAAQLRPARHYDPQTRRTGSGRGAGQRALCRPGRRSVQGADRGLQPAHDPAAPERHLHPLFPGHEDERAVLHEGLSHRDPLGVR